MATPTRTEAQVGRIAVSAYEIPTDEPESDGTFAWESTTVVVVELEAAGERGLGYTYGPRAVGTLVEELLADVVRGRDALDVGASWLAMGAALRNAGRPGIGAMAVAAVDIWKTTPFVALLVSFSCLWLVRYVDPRFSWLLELSSSVMAITFYVQSFLILTELHLVEQK